MPCCRRLRRLAASGWASRLGQASSVLNFRTANRFRTCHLATRGGLFDQVLKHCLEAVLRLPDHVALDGTRIQANAPKHKAMSCGRVVKAEPEWGLEIAELQARRGGRETCGRRQGTLGPDPDSYSGKSAGSAAAAIPRQPSISARSVRMRRPSSSDASRSSPASRPKPTSPTSPAASERSICSRSFSDAAAGCVGGSAPTRSRDAACRLSAPAKGRRGQDREQRKGKQPSRRDRENQWAFEAPPSAQKRYGPDPRISMHAGGNHQCAASNRSDTRKRLTQCPELDKEKSRVAKSVHTRKPCGSQTTTRQLSELLTKCGAANGMLDTPAPAGSIGPLDAIFGQAVGEGWAKRR